jgi:phosphoribosylamine--glycine ligase
MKVLIIGSGGREHALAWKIAQSDKLTDLYIAPGNAGTGNVGTNLEIGVSDFEGIKAKVLELNIELVIVGPEAPLVEGIRDFFESDSQLKQVPVIGPDKYAATLEGSKEFAKEFMDRHNIPTAAYKSFTSANLEEGYAFLDSLNAPYVLKADGLAAGKGVLIIDDLQEAKDSLKEMLEGQFGDASAKVVIEEFLSGIEVSYFAITDGENYVLLPEAKDYKRIGEGDTGLNTGGMGAVSPVPFADADFTQKVVAQIVEPTINGFKKDGINYRGFVFFGLINVNNDPYVIEYNVRMGDPETEVVIPRVKSDLLELLAAIPSKTINKIPFAVEEKAASTIMMVAGGYPESYEKGKEIKGLSLVGNSIVFHAGTAAKDSKVVSNGGRVIAITSFGEDIFTALETSYKSIGSLSFEGAYYRTDLGKDLK